MKKENKAFHPDELNAMSTDQLETLLRTELDGDRDREIVMQILSILKKRDTCNSVQSLLGRNTKRPQGEFCKWIIRFSAVAAVLAILLLTIPPVMGAENIFEVLGRWTQDIFNFFTPGDGQTDYEYVFSTDHDGLQQIYDAVTEQCATVPVVPTWVPEGYELNNISVVHQRLSRKVLAQLSNDSQYIIFTYEIFCDAASNLYPKDVANAEMVEILGTKHYIIANDGKWTVAWNIENVECSITVNADIDDIYKIIKSIYREEN